MMFGRTLNGNGNISGHDRPLLAFSRVILCLVVLDSRPLPVDRSARGESAEASCGIRMTGL